MERRASWQPDATSGVAIRWVDANGLTFEVAEAGAGDHLALCLHGFPELHYSWRHQIPLLAQKGYWVWAPNMRGYGGSDRPRGVKPYRLHTLAQDVAALIDASGAREVTLIAHDWGALVAWHFAIRKVRPLARLVIMNVPHPLCSRRELKKWRQFRKSWYIFAFQIPKLFDHLLSRNGAAAIGEIFARSAVNKNRFEPDDVRPYRRAAARPGRTTAMLNYYRALLRYPDVLEIRDGRVETPTLIIWGEQDVAIDIHTLDGTEQYVPDLVIERLPHASHWVQQDAPEEVNALLDVHLPTIPKKEG